MSVSSWHDAGERVNEGRIDTGSRFTRAPFREGDRRGPLGVAPIALGADRRPIADGGRIAPMVAATAPQAVCDEVAEPGATARGAGGSGLTGGG
ncbi:hypothetical protein [Paracoccus spongiarum]|uniref:Uncharacterized protein n=1 Tax=Paracoccus spongiarum TaxID=3064387 RepID=A0ABT9J9R2_9RHOB|nr:hypothetical protein [Paracoccus sp. 2205BS29-5]MDP5305821.1 hypothetical protein [Paracoccus sp. 2205BS29-5]